MVDVVVVSLPDARSRRDTFARHAAEATVPWRFFDACTQLAPDLHYDERRALICKGRGLTVGELGCYSSHYMVWQSLLQDYETDAYVVLEDDSIIDWSFLAALSNQDLSADGINYLRLAFKKPSRMLVRKKPFVSRATTLVELVDLSYGTLAYYVNKSAAEIFVKRFRTIVRPIDDQLDRHWEHGLPIYSVFPFPVFETNSVSTIGLERFACAEKRTLARRAYIWRDRVRKRIAVHQRLHATKRLSTTSTKVISIR